ncbi:non-structural protein [Barleria chlorosis-associated virus]|uniref:Non-structural protein n=1 Tax=Barleria chlorosis-associated virus TaxID=3433955 RepID=A0AC61MZJ0_9VIRU|nr:non-structural protein [Barleria severe mosaic virus]
MDKIMSSNSVLKSMVSKSKQPNKETDHMSVSSDGTVKSGVKITEKALMKNMKKKMEKKDGMKKIIDEGASKTSLGTYEDKSSIIDASDNLLSRLTIDKSHHISSWKKDVLVGNDQQNVYKKIFLNPTWDSKKQFLMLSRIILWICPIAPDTKGKLKVSLIDPNKLTQVEKEIVHGELQKFNDPVCFIFSLSWSFPSSSNVQGKCPELHILSDEKYKQGSEFGAIMYSWTKEFSDSPRADSTNLCQIVPISRAVRYRSPALLKACALMIPKGHSQKQIKTQLQDLIKYVEKAAEEEEENDIVASSEDEIVTFDTII